MRRTPPAGFTFALALVAAVAAGGTAAAQHGGHGQHGGGQGHLAAQRCLEEFTVAEIERARSDVRLVHLLAHLRTRELLTEDQRRAYHHARWGAR